MLGEGEQGASLADSLTRKPLPRREGFSQGADSGKTGSAEEPVSLRALIGRRRLPQPHARAAAVLRYELDAGG